MRGNTQGSVLRWCSDYSPRKSAEETPLDIAEYEVRRYQTRRNPEGLFRSAWTQVEFSMNRNLGISNEARDCYLDQTQALIGGIISNPKAHQDTMLGALVLSTYIPIFKKRAHREQLTTQDCEQVYQSIGQAMMYLEPLKIDQPPQWQMTEAAVLALASRTRQPKYLLYPTSPREENSDHAWLNHDSYFMKDGVKMPLQHKLVETDKEYNDWITFLTLQPMVDKAFKRLGLDDDSSASRINYMFSLIIAETNGLELDESEASFLNILSSAVVAHYSKAEAKTKMAA